VLFKRIYIFLFLICICITANAQLLNFKNYSIDDGLPQSQILDIFQDHTGIVWFATNGGGVSRYDGTTFHNLSIKDGLNHNRAYTVFEDSHKTIWIGTSRGLNKYVNNKLQRVNDTLINQKGILKVHEHSNGDLWFGTNNGIVIYDGKNFKPFIRNDSIGDFQVWSMIQDKIGNTWIATMSNGVFCFDGKNMIHFTGANGLCDPKVRDLLINGDKVLMATAKGINTYDLSKSYTGSRNLDTLKMNAKPFLETVYKIYKDSSGVIWAGTGLGVSRISYGKIRAITKNNGLCNSLIYSIIQDREGNMWFGSFTGGVSKYKNDLFINISEKNGLVGNTVMTFFKDSKDNLWIGTWGGGVSKMNYKAWRNKDSIIFQNFVQEPNGLRHNNVWSICEDKKGDIWLGTSAQGISVYDGKKFTSYGLKEGLHGLHIQAMICDKKGSIWIAHENGLDKYDGKTFTFYGKDGGLFTQGVSAIYEDYLGNIWFGCPDKIVKYDGKKFSTILRPEGFPKIRNIVIDNLGYIWFSTDAGVCVYNGKKFIMITEMDGLSSNMVYFIQPDGEGYMWLGTNNGIDRLNLDRFVNNKEIVLKHYGKEEGFIGVECNQNAFFKDADGKLWFGTIEGITIYDPRKELVNRIEPQTQITGIRLFLEKTDFNKYSDSLKDNLPVNLKLPYDKNHITFDFVGVSQTITEKVKYQFILQGFDGNWLPEGKGTSTTYSNLPPGKYTFMLKACNNDGLWNKKPVTFSFEIIPPFWKQPWFYVTIILLFAFSIFAYVKTRERNLQRSRKRLKEEVANRTKELLEEKEKLQVAYSEIDLKNRDITDSIHYAKRIQEAILPSDFAFKQALPDSFVFYKPKDIVSGDFYWLEKWGPQILVAAVDCTGHGVPGAFMSIVAHNLLTQTVNVLGLSKPALILNETNSQLSKKLNQDPDSATVRDGMDISICAINYKKLTIEFAGANNPIWVIRNNEIIEVSGDKFPVGAFIGEELQRFTHHEWEIQKDDCIYLFTDGYLDQFGGPKGKKFKNKQFQSLLLEIHQKPMTDQKEILEKRIEEWQGDLEQIDDMLVIGIRI
jgi:ligand-binding sensor domain-containing protein/serine phosphatase RsbU (regulator of sigma subunit)